MTQVDEGPESPATPAVLTVGAPTLGEVLAERYELQEHINNDAFGRQVWRGVDVIMDGHLAIDGDIFILGGTHRDAVRMHFDDWFDMVQPRIELLSEPA